MGGSPSIGALFPPAGNVRDLPGAARRLEALGIDELWVAEDCFMAGGIAAAATALAFTERLHVGVGLLPASVRNAAFAAMELATLAELYPGRFTAAFGHGVEAWMRQVGARPPNRIAALQEVVGSVRALLSGDSVTCHGRFVELEGTVLTHPPSIPPPLLIGTAGAQAIAVARSHADGLVLPEGAGEAAISWAAGLLGPGKTIIAYSWLRIDDDGERAKADLLPTVSAWRDRGSYPTLMAHGGLEPGADVDAPGLARVAVAGTPDQCAQTVAHLAAAGAASVVVLPIGDDPEHQLRRFVDEVLPRVADHITLSHAKEPP